MAAHIQFCLEQSDFLEEYTAPVSMAAIKALNDMTRDAREDILNDYLSYVDKRESLGRRAYSLEKYMQKYVKT